MVTRHFMRNKWRVIDADLPILTFRYSFGPGLAESLAIGVPGGLAVVSPPCGVAPSVIDELHTFGNVRALVAPNAFHHLGIPLWKEHFPDVPVFAPAQSVARVMKYSRQEVKPISESSDLLRGGNVEMIDMPHYRTGEVLVRADTARGHAWYVTDCVMNWPGMPKNLLIRAAFGLTRSAPGLRFNNVSALFMMKDRRAVRRWLVEQIDAKPPHLLVPCHGDVVEMSAPGAMLRGALA